MSEVRECKGKGAGVEGEEMKDERDVIESQREGKIKKGMQVVCRKAKRGISVTEEIKPLFRHALKCAVSFTYRSH